MVSAFSGYGNLRFLREAVTDFMDAGQIDNSSCKSYLVNYEALKSLNAQQIHQELEWE